MVIRLDNFLHIGVVPYHGLLKSVSSKKRNLRVSRVAVERLKERMMWFLDKAGFEHTIFPHAPPVIRLWLDWRADRGRVTLIGSLVVKRMVQWWPN